MIEYSNSRMRQLIEEFVHSERDRGVLRRRFIDGITIERIAEEFEMSPRQIRNIVHKYEPILLKKYL